jgi:hypothetical protein
MDNPDQGWLARLRETDVCLVSASRYRGRDSLDGYRNRSRYYQGIAHEVLIRAVAATVMSSVDGSRVARDKLTQWHWSGAVFCPAC